MAVWIIHSCVTTYSPRASPSCCLWLLHYTPCSPGRGGLNSTGWYAKSPTVQDTFWSIPDIISCAGVTMSWGLHAKHAPNVFFCSTPPQLFWLQPLISSHTKLGASHPNGSKLLIWFFERSRYLSGRNKSNTAKARPLDKTTLRVSKNISEIS